MIFNNIVIYIEGENSFTEIVNLLMNDGYIWNDKMSLELATFFWFDQHLILEDKKLTTISESSPSFKTYTCLSEKKSCKTI